jgi:hypothetical protein
VRVDIGQDEKGAINPSHDRHTEPGFPHPRQPHVIAQTQGTKFSVLRMAAQYPAGPEYVVCAGNDAVAQFFSEDDARLYALWRNLKYPNRMPTQIG